MKKLLLLSLLSLFYLNLDCQLLRDNEVDEATVKPWVEKVLKNYEDRYIFQPNDGNYLIINVTDSKVSAQIYFPSHWVDYGLGLEGGHLEASECKFHSEYIPLTGVNIKEGHFYSDQYKGEFITFESDTTYQGIKIYDSWSIWPGYEYEIGVKRQEQLKDIYQGKYTEASLTILDSIYVSSFSKEDLKIMRNEIYARYHFRFEEGGLMAKYFSEQEWYVRRYTSVQQMLTWIEVRNIDLIKSIEKIK